MLERLEHRGIVDNILQQMEFGSDGGARRATHFTDKENSFKQPPTKKSKDYFKLLRKHVHAMYRIFLSCKI